MYHPIKGGTKITLRYDGNYQVWVPPKPSHSRIANSHLKKSEQFFRRTELPDFYIERAAEEAYKREQKWELYETGQIKYQELFTDQVLEDFRRKEWTKRLFGYWFYNFGEPIYITGTHYFYLNWTNWDHSINDGYPIFYENQVHRFYFRRLCETDPRSLGYIMLGPRGYGKSTEELATILERSTKFPRQTRSFLQTKTDDEAKDTLFKGKIVPAFNKLPDFFKPEFSHSSNPTTEMMFSRPRVSGKAAKKVSYKPEFELGNVIMIAGSGEKALDSETAQDILSDEVGKTKPQVANVDKRAKVNRFSVFRNSRKTGIQRLVSTVEELEAGGEACLKVWSKSNPEERLRNGQTTSSLYRIRESILDTDAQFADKYGRILHDNVCKNPESPAYGMKNIDYHMQIREDLKNNQEDFADWVRKNPIYEADMFIKKPGSTSFNTHRLQEYRTAILQAQHLWVKGNFKWTGEPFKSKVEFERDDHAGRWELAVLLGDEDEENRYGKANNIGFDYDYALDKNLIVPMNRSKMHFGVDPIKDIKTGRGSKMSAHLKLRYLDNLDRGKPMEEWRSDRFIGRYVQRLENPRDCYEDVAMAMIYYGTWANIEKNVGDFHTYLKDHGMHRFIMTALDFEEDSGLSTNMNKDEAIQSTKNVQLAYINKMRTAFKINLPQRINYLPFEPTVAQCIEFSPEEWTKFDEVVSIGYTLLGDDSIVVDDFDPSSNEVDTEDWFDLQDISGDEPAMYENVEDYWSDLDN